MTVGSSGAALFAGSASEFIRMAPASELTAHLVREFNRRWGTVSQSEEQSWRRSLTVLAGVASQADVDTAGVGVELRLPLTDKRIDVSFVGRDAKEDPRVILVELKQWDQADPSDFPDNVVVGGVEHLHPSIQVGAYADYLRDSHSAFTEHGFQLQPCAYLHDMPAREAAMLRDEPFEAAVAAAPLFGRGDEPHLTRLLRESVAAGGGMDLLPKLVNGRYSPSKQLIASIARSLEGSPVWTLLDEQRLAYNVVNGLVKQAAQSGQKAVVIVVGGPGTGKSVIAVHLLVSLSGEYRVCHATGSKAFTTNLRALGPRSASAVFQYFNSFKHKKTPENHVDVLLCDEAHRIRKTSNDRFTKRSLRSEISQVRELIRAARVSVFLLDERQNVRPGEIGTVSEIELGAEQERVPIHRVDLGGQYRCNGCSAYIDWVEGLFSESPQTVGGWRKAGEYDLRVFESPAAMEKELKAIAATGLTCRMVAGFCWPWSDPRENSSLVPDVKIGSWRRPWNEKSQEQTRAGGAGPPPSKHPYYLWATQPARIGEIGCIYSAQGFEFDYCGVILGNDFVWRGGEWRAVRAASHDPAIRKGAFEPGQLEALLRHTYRVLLTRGMRGTFVYSTDAETQSLLADLVGEND